MIYLHLDDPTNLLQLGTFSQATPIEQDFISYLTFETPDEYDFRRHGFAVPVGKLIRERLNLEVDDWHLAYAGVPLHRIVHTSAQSLAHLYQQKLKR